MAYAQGKHAWGICDRCGFRCRYLQMRMEWTGFKVCSDAEGLYQPRPEQSLPLAQLGQVTTEVPGPMTSTANDPPSMIGHAFNGLVSHAAVGDLTITTE